MSAGADVNVTDTKGRTGTLSTKQGFFLHRIVLYLQASKTIISHAIHISKKLYVKIVKNEFLSSTHFQ